jgi:signal transduction histidine kinase
MKQHKTYSYKSQEEPQTKQPMYTRLLRTAKVTAEEAANLADALLLCLSRVCECTRWPFAHARILSQDGALDAHGAKEVWYVPFLDAQTFRDKALRMSHLRSGIDWRARMVSTARPIVLRDLARELDAKGQHAARELGLKSALGMPVLAGESATAVCEFFSSTSIQEDDLLQEVFAAIGTTLAHAVEAKQSRERLSEMTRRLLSLQDDERRRLARELHDTTGQNLSMMIVDIDFLGREQFPSSEARAKLAECGELARRSLAEVRTFSYVLHPPLLEELGVFPALRQFVEGFSERSGILVNLDLPDGSARMPLEVETTIFRVVQESLSNVRKHSHASKATVRIALHPGEIAVTVEDNGSGLPAAIENVSYPTNVGVGIGSMRERVRQCGGHLQLHSHGVGTQLQVSLPLQLTQPTRARAATA